MPHDPKAARAEIVKALNREWLTVRTVTASRRRVSPTSGMRISDFTIGRLMGIMIRLGSRIWVLVRVREE